MHHTAGTLPPLLCFRHKSRGNIHWFLVERAFPFARRCFCRRQGLPPSLSLGAQGTLGKRDHRVVSVLSLSLSKSPVLSDSLADARLRSISPRGCRERPCGPAPLWRLRRGARPHSTLPPKAGPGRRAPTTGVAQSPCQGRPGCWAEAWHDRARERASARAGAGGCRRRRRGRPS